MSRSLRTRIALWMSAGAITSIIVFGLAAWLLVAHEIEEEDAEMRSPSYVDEGPEDAAEDAGEQILGAMAIAAPIGLIVAVGLGFLWARRITRPLQQMIAAASKLSSKDLSARIEVPKSDDEVSKLATSLNEMLDRIEVGFETLERHVTEASHELRTPIAVFTTQLDVALRKERSSKEWVRTATKALREAQRMGRTIDALLRLARNKANMPRLLAFDLAEQVELVGRECETLSDRKLEFQVQSCEGPILVVGDQDAIRSALRSLTDNANEHAADGGLVTLSVESDERTATAHIDDNGRGIAVADRQRIFSPFVRTDSNRSGDHRGLGLGLAIAMRLIEASGGTLRADDSPSGGARFSITLPLSDATEVSSEAAQDQAG